MMKTKPHVVLRTGLLLRTSSAGYEFDENSNVWMLDGSIRVRLGFLFEFGVEEKTSDGFRRTISRFAQELSSSYCVSIINRAIKFLRVSESKNFSAEDLSAYREKLDEEHQWELGVLRSFFERW